MNPVAPFQPTPPDNGNDWQAHPFVRGLSAEALATLGTCAMPVTFEAGQLIFREGETANRFYLLLEGGVQLEAEAPDRPAVPVAELGAGDVLGWSWLFPPYTWNFTARAVTPVKAVFFYGTWLRERSETDVTLGYELMKRTAVVLMQRLQVTRQQLVLSYNLR
ncbi:MAG: cyclic nucleotide-binding domain-containing protein [Verrucomicrobiota bacterium]